jgi:hypothetical protein
MTDREFGGGRATPSPHVGDHSDITVVTLYGEIPWNRISRVSDDEMKRPMKELVNKVFTVLIHWEDEEFMSALIHWGVRQTVRWDDPEVLAGCIVH